MSAVPDFTTPREAVRAMQAAGAVFTVRRRCDSLGTSFSYGVTDGGDLEQCRAILAAVKSRPPAFFEAFKAQVQNAVATAEGSAS